MSISSQSIKNKLIHLPSAILANFKYRFAGYGLNVIGVTGTDGKTTTTTGLYHILHSSHYRVGMITTVEAKLVDKSYPTGLHTTTPSSWIIQSFLNKAKLLGISDMIIESTSHGLDQYRLWGVPYKIGVVTNVTHEHLDYHKTFENYLLAKAKLFNKVKFAILNYDDQSYSFFCNYIYKNNPGCKIISYGLSDEADVKARNIKYHSSGSEFVVNHDFMIWDKSIKVKTPYIGEFNIFNVLAMIACLGVMGLSQKSLVKGVFSLPNISGRQEYLFIKKRHVFIDFAHTPNGMDSILRTIKEIFPQSRILTVFGCTGERDYDKRPLMGEIAIGKSDVVVMTHDDTRSENIWEIFDQIEQGCVAGGGKFVSSDKIHKNKSRIYYKIDDRQLAIDMAVKNSDNNDVIVLLGKGHEKTILIGKNEKSWSDKEAVLNSISNYVN